MALLLQDVAGPKLIYNVLFMRGLREENAKYVVISILGLGGTDIG